MKIEESLSSATELRLIREFDGSGIQSVVEWFDKAELVCRLRGLSKPECVIPLRLTGGAFAVYQQLSVIDKGDINKIKASLYAAFAADSFLAYEQFVSRKLRSGESVDVFLAALRNLSFRLSVVCRITCWPVRLLLGSPKPSDRCLEPAHVWRYCHSPKF
ncbi:Uncharacterised protein g5189 [Pycnogonum litorale]